MRVETIGNATLYLGDCRDLLRVQADNSIDAVVTDPPYELGFMGKAWDRSGVAFDAELWREVLRVAKPGAHLLAFGGSRTYHRMACAIEDAGWEVRDQIMWIYGSGFPKSLDVGKALDKAAGHTRARIPHSRSGGFGDGISVAYAHDKWTTANAGTRSDPSPITKKGEAWQGWGTALKPAHEPIVVARKPLIGTVAANVLEHGTGALNIDGCRIAGGEISNAGGTRRSGGIMGASEPLGGWEPSHAGRWPANVIHDGSEEVLAAFPNTSSPWIGNPNEGAKGGRMFGGSDQSDVAKPEYRDAGSAARFFYCAKASQSDREDGCDGLPEKTGGMVSNTSGQHITRRDGGAPGQRCNHHPTVKPTDLMRYLCRLVTPPGGLILDPFTGSGSTGRGALLEGFRFLGFEHSAEYIAIAEARITAAVATFADSHRQERLFA